MDAEDAGHGRAGKVRRREFAGVFEEELVGGAAFGGEVACSSLRDQGKPSGLA